MKEEIDDTVVVNTETEKVDEPREIHSGARVELSHEIEFIEKISSGGMGSVWRARLLSSEDIGRDVAVKLAHKGRSFSEALKKEAELVTKLNYRLIAKLISLDKIYGRDALIMEFVSGRNFQKIVEMHNTLGLYFPEKFAGFVGWLACEALNYGHNLPLVGKTGRLRTGLIHGDISIQNFIGESTGGIRMLDYGTSIVAGEPDITGIVGGKLHFLAPEVLEGKTPDFCSDLYSLGATLYNIGLGEPPISFPDGSNKTQALEMVKRVHGSGELEKLVEEKLLKSGVLSREFGEIVYESMRKDPEKRFSNVDARGKAMEMKNRLTPYLYGKGFGPTQEALGMYLEIVGCLLEGKNVDDRVKEMARKQMGFLFDGDDIVLKRKKQDY